MPIREVNIAEHFDATLPLMQQNWRETGFDFEFAPSKEIYEAAQASGVLLALGAFHEDELVGYATAVLSPHPFNPAVKMCLTDALFVSPLYRGGALPGRLMLTIERIAKERGAKYVMWHTRAGTRLADMLRKRGYIDADTVVMKEL